MTAGAEGLQQPGCAALFYVLDDGGRESRVRRLEGQMEVLRHQNPTDQAKSELEARRFERPDKNRAIGGIGNDTHAAVGAAGDKLQLPGLVAAMVEWHDKETIGR